jgi:Protein of unknown function (DUF4058)
MPSPFPGMDPYLEQPTFWASFHSRLIVALADALAPKLRPKYYIEVETRSYSSTEDDEILVGIPDAVVLSARSVSAQLPSEAATPASVATQVRPKKVSLPMPVEMKERYLEVREIGTDALITAIELLSPKNKRKGAGREAYEAKRSRVLASLSHLIEIDLLRGNEPMPMKGNSGKTDYRVLVSRSSQRPLADLYDFSLPDPIPSFPLPLKPEDEEPIVNLQEIFAGVYERAGYDLRLDYQDNPPLPALTEPDLKWLDILLMSQREP